MVGTDLTGALSVYNVPSAIADARAATDGSTTNVKTSSALIAVARNVWISNLTLKAAKDAAINTARAYYASGAVKQQENVVTLYPIEVARHYTFDAPTKSPDANVYIVSQIWIEQGDSGPPVYDASQQS